MTGTIYVRTQGRETVLSADGSAYFGYLLDKVAPATAQMVIDSLPEATGIVACPVIWVDGETFDALHGVIQEINR